MPPSEVLSLVSDTLRVCRLLGHPLRHAFLLRVMLHKNTRVLCRLHPRLPYKYLVEYASLALTTEQRRLLMIDHYDFVQKHFVGNFSDCISQGRICLWERESDTGRMAIHLDFPAKMHTEGELCLTLTMDGLALYRMIFIVGSGALLGVDAANAVLITCIQGLRDAPHVRAASMRCHDVHPAELLMAALTGVAETVQIATLVGIRTRDQIADCGRTFFSYDDFFSKYGKLQDQPGSYIIRLPIEQKNIALIAAKHRNRTRTKRAFRLAVGEAAGCAMARLVLPVQTQAENRTSAMPSDRTHPAS